MKRSVFLNIFLSLIFILLFILSGAMGPRLYEDVTGNPLQIEEDRDEGYGQDAKDSGNENNGTEENDSSTDTNTEYTISSEDVSRYFSSQLTGQDKEIYDLIYQGASQRESVIKLPTSDMDRISNALYYVTSDHPEIFWCGANVYQFKDYNPKDNKSSIKIQYTYSNEEIEYLKKKIAEEEEKCLSEVSAQWDDYEKILYIYRYLINLIEYDHDAVKNETTENDQNIESALVKHNTVCAGYAKTTSYLLHKLNIESIYVMGDIVGSEGDGGGHAWNIVKCNGRYYYLDTTWGDPAFVPEGKQEQHDNNIDYYYFLVNEDMISISHILNRSMGDFPECTSLDDNYYVKNGMYYTAYNEDAIWESLCSDIDKKRERSTFVFSNKEDYKKAVKKISEELYEKAYFRMIEKYPEQTGKTTYHSYDDNQKSIIQYWNW